MEGLLSLHFLSLLSLFLSSLLLPFRRIPVRRRRLFAASRGAWSGMRSRRRTLLIVLGGRHKAEDGRHAWSGRRMCSSSSEDSPFAIPASCQLLFRPQCTSIPSPDPRYNEQHCVKSGAQARACRISTRRGCYFRVCAYPFLSSFVRVSRRRGEGSSALRQRGLCARFGRAEGARGCRHDARAEAEACAGAGTEARVHGRTGVAGPMDCVAKRTEEW